MITLQVVLYISTVDDHSCLFNAITSSKEEVMIQSRYDFIIKLHKLKVETLFHMKSNKLQSLLRLLDGMI